MDALDLAPEAIETLERDFARTSRAQELLELARVLADGLTGDEGLQGRLAALLREARRLEGLDPAGKPLAGRLAAAAVELNDLGAEFSALGRELQFEPAQVEALEKRMNAWLEFKRRHGGDPRAVAGARDALRSKVEAQADLAGTLARLDAEIGEAHAAVRKEAAALRARREKGARDLAKVAAANIDELGFAKADFKIRLVPLAEPGPSGDCGCEFLFSPNVGEDVRPLARIASGGELARVMLALKAVLAELDDVSVLVFDEVDANVGGEIGRVVGEKMARIGKSRQVFCVTHLPQVAAQAASHLGRHKGPVQGKGGRSDHPDSGGSQGARERARPDARRSQCEERPRPRRAAARLKDLLRRPELKSGLPGFQNWRPEFFAHPRGSAISTAGCFPGR